MPYIDESARHELASHTSPSRHARTAGEVNYQLTCICLEYLYHQGECYQTYNDIIGALEGAKLEMYRRKIAPYEDKKMEENDDVY